MLTPLTTEEYAQHLIQRYKEMRSLVDDEETLYQYFLGAKDSIQESTLGPKVAKSMRESYGIAERVLFGHPVGTDCEPDKENWRSNMDEQNREQEQQGPQPQPKQPVPTPGDLFRAWREGGEAKLAEMLPDVPDEEE
jgi:hypothetical protein